MSLIQMSISGAVMILVIVVLRALFLHKLPKRTFLVLWSVVLARLLVPYSLPSIFSAYNLTAKMGAAEQIPSNLNIIRPPTPDFPAINTAQATQAAQVDFLTTEALTTKVDLFTIVWLAGFLILSVFFVISYIRSIKKFGESLPVDDEYITKWLSGHRPFRKISVRQSDMISTPLTYGVFRPVILLPKKLLQDKTPDFKSLKYVLTHEYLHIRRFDAVFKIFLTAALCIHWFDPLVWVMFIIANRDIEISCDEGVVRMLGENEKSDYAMALISMEERKSSAAPLITHFNKNSTKERIVNIMKFKKTTALAIISAAFITLGTTAAFATSAKTDKSDDREPTISHEYQWGYDYLTTHPDTSGSDDRNAAQGEDHEVIPGPDGLPYLYFDFSDSDASNSEEIIPNGVTPYVTNENEPVTLEQQFKDILLNTTDPERRMNAIFKAVQMGLTADDLADIELSDEEIAVLKGEVPPSWWRGDEPPAGRRVMTPDGEADSSEMVNKSDMSDMSDTFVHDNGYDSIEVPYTDAFGYTWTEIPVVVKVVIDENGKKQWIGEKPDVSCALHIFTDAIHFYPIISNGEPKTVDYSKEYSRLERVGDVLIAYPASDE